MTDRLVPKLVTVLQEGYSSARFKQDALSGLTVAIVALPLSMAIAIASGVTPDRGLFTAIIGGFFVSALGGSRHQIGGPAGAFIVLVAATVNQFGIDGLLLATALSGLMMMAAGWLRLGNYIKFIPYPVTVGFTAGIGVIIFSSQIKDLLGLTLTAPEPGPIIPKYQQLIASLPTLNPSALAISAGTILLILAVKRLRPNWPNMLIAVALASLAAALLSLPVETIGSRFGGIPRTLPAPSLPEISLDKVLAVLPSAFSFTLLGSIESLLSAVVADGMTGRRHRSNMELVAQGVANIASPLFGGICVTGTIARTATNVRAGATSPFSGMMHSLFLLVFMLVAAPLAAYIPLAALAGLLAVVSYNMIEKHAFAALIRSSRGDAMVLIVTLALVIFRDLTEGIIGGFALGAMLFINRMSKAIVVSEAARRNFAVEMREEDSEKERPVAADDPDTVVYHINGVFFFGAAATVGSVLDRIADQRRNFVLDCSSVPFIDSTAASVIESSLRKAARHNVTYMISGASYDTAKMLRAHGVAEPRVAFYNTVEDALSAIRTSRPDDPGE
ncbi:SulP family inorganic anion transporter [Rhizobium sp. PAMB 3182]